MPIELTSANFEKEVLQESVPVLVDFWATWCMPCKMLAPTIESLDTDFNGKVKIAKLDVDTSKDVAAKYGVMSIPTVIVFVNGEIAEQLVGIQPKSAYEATLNKYIK